MDSKKHSEDEIVKAAEKKISNNAFTILGEQKTAKVNIALEHTEDGVLYSYDVFFDKKENESGGTDWVYKEYINYTI